MRAYLAFFCTTLAATPILAAEYRNIPWMPGALLEVGQSAVVHSVRADKCGSKPPVWSAIRPRLPDTKLGTFSDGDLGWRWSSGCNGFIPARGIVYTAKKKGKETLAIRGTASGTGVDYTRIEVR